MFNKLKNLWNNNGFEILFVCSLILIGVLALFKIGKKGTWSTSWYNKEMVNHFKEEPINTVVQKNVSKGEAECRRVLQQIFRKPFNTSRPNFLRNPVTGDNFNLELDCFEEYLNLAVEYNGQQHYKFLPYFHKNKEAFRNQGYRDELKKRMCKDNKINLITVPYTIKIPDIEKYLIHHLKLTGYIIPKV